jgi:cyclopropane fatty-acyl-phospholipid synthase-like methyltransferase
MNNRNKKVSADDIVTYYDSCEVHYKMMWHLDTHRAMHYGYWTNETKNLKEALFNTNDLLAGIAELKPGMRVLDAGCGVGGSSLYIAQKYGCTTHGISLSTNQIQKASSQASLLNLGHLCKFSVADFCDTSFDSESFDIVWAIESVCHANDKAEFLKEAFRLLKPGGKLVMLDFFRTMPTPNQKQQKWLSNWGQAWAVPQFEYDEWFVKWAEQVGFDVIECKDISKNIWPSALRLYMYFFPSWIWNNLLRMTGKFNPIHMRNTWSTFYQFHSLQKKYWRYMLIVATKSK